MGSNSNIISFTTVPQVLNNLRRRVQQARISRGWSQKELAIRSGIKLPTYAYFEQSGHISLERLAALCEALGCLDDLEQILVRQQLPSIDELKRPPRQRGRTLSTL
jgi:transcriptional regulator with XRE-family HTH domain